MQKLTGIIICGLVGIYFLVHGFLLLRGYDKWRYLAFHSRAAGIYAHIPLGFCALFWMLAFISENRLFIEVGVAFGGLGILAMIIRPSFLKPAWFRRLEREHGDIFMLLVQDANERMGLDVWADRMQTEEDIMEWAAQVRERFEQEVGEYTRL